jgi:5'-3' exonuclease
VRLLVVDLPGVFWTVALSGAGDHPGLSIDYALRDIHETAARGYDAVVICVDYDDRDEDWPQNPWRRSIWPGYKLREPRPANLWQELRSLINGCDVFGWTVFRSLPRFDSEGASIGWHEADDTIGSVVAWARTNGHGVDIRSNDSDLAQLVRDNAPAVRLLRKHHGERSILNWGGVMQWQGVPPPVIAPLKAIAGDTGDGYGDLFPGIGESTAKAMLRASKGDAVLAVEMAIASEQTNKDGKTVPRWIKTCRQVGVERVRLGLQLARVALDLPLEYDRIGRAS